MEMSKVMLLNTSDHVNFCKRINAKIAKEDWDRLDVAIFVTSSEKNKSFASTTLKILSPLYCEITKDLEQDKDYGRVLILPDFESSTVKHLLDLVSKGATDKLTGDEEKITKDIIDLADALEINMPAETLTSDLKKTQKLKLRDIKDLIPQNPSDGVNNNNIGPRQDEVTPTTEENVDVADIFVCSDCGHGFSSEESANHKDGICKKELQSQHTAITQDDDDMSNQNVSYQLRKQCTPCGSNFKTVYDKKRHMYYVHGYCYDCINCDAIFSTQSSLDLHKKMVHGPGPFKCEYYGCGVFFSSKSDLFLHQHHHHKKMETPYNCKE